MYYVNEYIICIKLVLIPVLIFVRFIAVIRTVCCADSVGSFIKKTESGITEFVCLSAQGRCSLANEALL